jgi:hypothetical protein
MEYIGTREELLEFLPKNSIGAEIGVFKGEFAEILLEKVTPSKLYLIDPWQGRIESGDKDGKNLQYIDGNSFYQSVIVPQFTIRENVILLRHFSDILNTLPDNSLDWIYVDGDHQYRSVKYDLELCYKKVKQQGYILGHDYTNDMCPGVVKAVDEFCKEKNLTIKYLTQDGCPSYFIEKI